MTPIREEDIKKNQEIDWRKVEEAWIKQYEERLGFKNKNNCIRDIPEIFRILVKMMEGGHE